jgi:LmbE family N-acetylglucosaminyl deacetylase
LEFVHGGQYNWSSMAVAVTLKLQPRSEHRKIMDWIDDLLERTLVLVAHPDDECIAFGALLQRMREPLVVFATDGSPADPYFWQKYGSREAYAVLRRKEALESMRAAGVKDVLFLTDMPGGEKLVDQELFRNLHTAYDLLADAVARRMTPALLTLAYEGGHPDHDACSFLAAQLAQAASIPCWEAPLYHRDADGAGLFQDFRTPTDDVMDVRPTEAEQERKREMCRAYLSQGDFLQKFDVSREIVRPQASYDFTRPPHEGKTNYEVWQWSMTAQEVSAAFAEFLRVAPKRPGKEQ